MKKILALLIAVMMVSAMMTVALADPDPAPASTNEYAVATDAQSITFQCVFTNVGAAATFPQTEFTYTLSSGTAVTSTPVDGGTTVTQIYAGNLGNVSFSNSGNDYLTNTAYDSITTDAWDTADVAASGNSAVLTDDITIYFGDFPHAGIYRYVLTESALSDPQKNLNITNENSDAAVIKYLDVYVKNTAGANTDPSYNVYAAVITSSTDTATSYNTSTNETTYAYGDNGANKTQEFDHTYNAFSITLHKVLNGAMADTTKIFPFDVSFATTGNGVDQSSDPTPVVYTTPTGVTINWEASTNSSTATGSTTVGAAATHLSGLKGGESITFTNVPATVVSTILEKNVAAEGYAISVALGESQTGATLSHTNVNAGGTDAGATVTMASDNTAANVDVYYTNTLESISPTGVALRFGPYIIMACAAVALLVIMARRKKDNEDKTNAI